MKIVFFDINRLSFDGGAEKYLSEVGKTFKEKGDEVFFVGDCRPILRLFIWASFFLGINSLWKLPKLFGELKKVPSINKNSLKYISFFPLKLRSLIPFSPERKKIKNFLNQADMILIKNEIFEVLFFYLLRIKNKNKFLMVFSSLIYPFPNSFRAKIHNLVYGGEFYNYLIKKIGKIIVSNREDEKYFSQKVKIKTKNLFYIPYGLEESYFIKPSELKITSGFKVLFVGRMEEQKGVIYLKQLIESINRDKTIKDISFRLVGSGPLEEIPRHLAKTYPNVEYLGQLSPSEVRKHYLSSDLVVITSKWETFSYVCLEAQACGCPVVAFDIPGPKDIIETETGSLVPIGSVDLFSKEISKYVKKKINNPVEYQKYRYEISKITRNKYSLMKTTQSLENIVNDNQN